MPVGEVIVGLATTGSDLSLMTGGMIVAVLFMLGGGILFAYNRFGNQDEWKSDDWLHTYL